MHVYKKLRPIDCNNCPLFSCKGLWGWKYSFEKSLYFFSFWQNFETHRVKLSTVPGYQKLPQSAVISLIDASRLNFWLRFAIICLVIILELSPQDIVLHINVKSEIIPIVVACGIWWKNEIGRTATDFSVLRNNAVLGVEKLNNRVTNFL